MLDLIDPKDDIRDEYEEGAQIVYFKDQMRIHVMVNGDTQDIYGGR